MLDLHLAHTGFFDRHLSTIVVASIIFGTAYSWIFMLMPWLNVSWIRFCVSTDWLFQLHESRNPTFFEFGTDGGEKDYLCINFRVLESVTSRTMARLSQPEREFVQWYRYLSYWNMRQLRDFRLDCPPNSLMLDMPQHELCRVLVSKMADVDVRT